MLTQLVPQGLFRQVSHQNFWPDFRAPYVLTSEVSSVLWVAKIASAIISPDQIITELLKY